MCSNCRFQFISHKDKFGWVELGLKIDMCLFALLIFLVSEKLVFMLACIIIVMCNYNGHWAELSLMVETVVCRDGVE